MTFQIDQFQSMEDGEIESVDPGSLKPHPLSVKVYGDPSENVDDQLAESVALRGVMSPILAIKSSGIVVSGCTRRYLAEVNNQKILVRWLPEDMEELEVESLVLEGNHQRTKTKAQLAAEVREWHRVLIALRNLKKAENLPGNSAGGDDLAGTPQTKPIREEIAEKTGASPEEIKVITSVQKQIETAKRNGDNERADKLQSLLDTQGGYAAKKALKEETEAVRKPVPLQPLPDENIADDIAQVPALASLAGDSLALLQQFATAVAKLAGCSGWEALQGPKLKDIELQIRSIRGVINNNKPHAPCLHCNGIGCQDCFNSGVVPKWKAEVQEASGARQKVPF